MAEGRGGTGAARATAGDVARRALRAVRERGGLAGRVHALERDVEEIRRLNLRVAELTDLVAEALLPPERRDETALRVALERFAKDS